MPESGFVCAPGGLGGVEVVGGKFPGSNVSTPVSCLGTVEVEGGVVVLGGLEWSVPEVSGVAGVAGLVVGFGLLVSSELGWVVFDPVVSVLLFVVGVEVLFADLVFEYQVKAAPPKSSNKTTMPTINFVLLVEGVVFNRFSSIFLLLFSINVSLRPFIYPVSFLVFLSPALFRHVQFRL